MFDSKMTIAAFDPELAKAIAGERRRQEDHIELIASENYTSPAVMAAQGSQLTNKYAEGYPGKRYYGGCEYVDFDPEKPFVTSGIRLGSPAMTTRGFGTREAEIVGNLIADVLERPDDETIERVRVQVKALTKDFAVYGQ